MLVSPLIPIMVTLLISSTLLTTSANSMLMAWMGLEMNLMSMLSIILMNKKSEKKKSALMYFMIQALSSSFLLFSIMLMNFNKLSLNLISPSLLYSIPLLMKMAAAPFHAWFTNMLINLTWLQALLMLTWQKIAPLTMLSWSYHKMIMLFAMLSIFTGGVGGIFQSSFKKMIAYSSVNHNGWLISSSMLAQNLMEMYFLIYSLLSISTILILSSFKISFVKDTWKYSNLFVKISLFINLLSMGGMPPLSGFFPKLLIMKEMMESNMIMEAILFVLISIMTLFFYMSMITNYMTTNSQINKFTVKTNSNNYKLIIWLSFSINTLPIMLMAV